MRLSFSITVALLGGVFLGGLTGCESRRDRAVLEWVDEWPPAVTFVGTPPEELAKLDSFNYEAWEQQGRALPDAEETICRLLKSHDKRLDRRKAVRALDYIGTAKSVPVLIECLRDEDGWIHSEAVIGLRDIGIANDDVFRSLVRCLNTERGDTSVIAAQALAELFGKDAIEAIKQHQKNLDREAELMAKILEAVENGQEVRGNVPRAETKKAGDGK